MKVFVKVSRTLSLLLMFASLFCACNVPEPLPTATSTPDWTATPIPPSPTPTQTPTPTETPLPAYLEIDPQSLEGTGLTLRYSLDGPVREKLEELTERFNAENPEGITVSVQPAYSMEELAESIPESGTEKADIIIADSAWLRSLDRDNALLLDLSGFMNDPDLSLDAENIQAIMPVMLEPENRGNSFYALPLYAEPSFLFYNKTWAIELGFPDTPEDLAAFAKQACAAGKANYADEDDKKHGTGGWIISANPGGVISWLLTFAPIARTPGQILRDDNGDIFTDTADWLRNLYDNGCAWNSRVKEPYDYFANRYALFYSGTYADAERQYNAFEQSKQNGFDNWDLIVYPRRSAGKGTDPRIFADTVSIAIPQGEAKDVNAAWHFIRWLYQDEHAAELALSADGWPVQDNAAITRLYRNSGKDKLYQTLSYRQYLVNNDADENWLTDQMILSDGFAYIFNLSAKAEDIPGIWEQIGTSIAEINAVSTVSENGISEYTSDTGGTNENES